MKRHKSEICAIPFNVIYSRCTLPTDSHLRWLHTTCGFAQWREYVRG